MLDEAISIRPTPLAGKRRTAMTSSSSRAKPMPHKGRAPQRIRLGTFVTISTGVCARGNVKWQGRRSAFRGADAKQNCRAIGVGPSITAWSSIGFGLVSKNVAGWAPRKIQPRAAAPVQNEVAGLGRQFAAAQPSKPGSMSPLHAALLAHRREGARKIVDGPARFRGSTRRISRPAIVSASRPARSPSAWR